MATTMSSGPYKTSHGHSNSRSSRPSTTPRAPYPTVASVGQPRPPRLSPNTRSPRDLQSSSPNYFGLVVGDDSVAPESGPGPHVKQNWNTSGGSSRPGSKYASNERTPDYEMFRRQSERSIAFALSGLPASRTSSISSPTNSGSNQPRKQSVHFKVGDEHGLSQKPRKDSGIEDISFFNNVAHTDSPASLTPRNSISDHRQARLSLPASELVEQLSELTPQRSETIPTSITKENPAMAAPQEVAQAIENHPDKVLVLDLRVYPQYASSRIKGALNLCIPTTLLKRPAFNVQKLAETFTSKQNKEKFNTWKSVNYIIAYDATSSQPKEAVIPFNVLKKFAGEGWKGQGLVVKGGFHGFKKLVPRLVDEGQPTSDHNSDASALSISPPNKTKLPVAGGCEMPATENAANPFFGNIRQNMDLIDGVGQLPIKKPTQMSDAERRSLPAWLRRAASDSNEGKNVSDKFLGIEKTEQQVMRDALSCNVSYGTPSTEKSAGVQVAGIEKGNKNRYNNIFPYEHTRVRLQNVPSHGCDYVNASYVKAQYSNRKYIATQAPIPATFEDFWKVIWQQEARVIVMLTAESEGGQVKSHPYWKTNNYGPLRVKLVAEKRISLMAKARFPQSQSRPNVSRRLTTSNSTPAVEKTLEEATNPQHAPEEMVAIVRYLNISHASQPSHSTREVTQIQYTQWPDLGTPATPGAILGLIELVNKYQRATTAQSQSHRAVEPVPEGQQPLIVHCSAGCGRTGTFCTIDSVIDMMKRQKLAALAREHDGMDIDSEDDWLSRDDIDLVAKTVQDFRSQRLSMVQNLRQFVLCYESILQWLHDEAGLASDGMRRNFQG